MMRGFKITKDHINNDKMREGYEVDSWIDGTPIGEGPIVEFRLYDDDGILYYEGVFGDSDEEHDFYGDVQGSAVLNFGEWDAGCTTVKVKRDGKWVQEIG